jgi:hypothetical protein
MYYSNDILGRALPDAVQWISLGVAVVNAIMTLPAIVLVEKMGRRNLLILSAGGSLVSLVAVGFGMDSDNQTAASLGVIFFVALVVFPLVATWRDLMLSQGIRNWAGTCSLHPHSRSLAISWSICALIACALRKLYVLSLLQPRGDADPPAKGLSTSSLDCSSCL